MAEINVLFSHLEARLMLKLSIRHAVLLFPPSFQPNQICPHRKLFPQNRLFWQPQSKGIISCSSYHKNLQSRVPVIFLLSCLLMGELGFLSMRMHKHISTQDMHEHTDIHISCICQRWTMLLSRRE